MRTSLSIALPVTAIAAVGVATFALWLPAHHDAQAKAAHQAGVQALTKVAFPATFAPRDDATARIQICFTNAVEHCYVTAGDPRDNVAAVTQALAPVTTGTVHTSCHSVPIKGSPDTCDLTVPVKGGHLAVQVFSRVDMHEGKHLPWTWSGSYVQVVIA